MDAWASADFGDCDAAGCWATAWVVGLELSGCWVEAPSVPAFSCAFFPAQPKRPTTKHSIRIFIRKCLISLIVTIPLSSISPHFLQRRTWWNPWYCWIFGRRRIRRRIIRDSPPSCWRNRSGWTHRSRWWCCYPSLNRRRDRHGRSGGCRW